MRLQGLEPWTNRLRVSLSIDKEALSFFDAEKHEWICEPGKFEAIIAASAMDIKDVLKFELK